VSARLGVIPAAVGFVLFGGVQRAATRLARPELWVFGALLGAETLIAVAVRLHDGGITPAMALLCWPVAGLAGRFPNRASRLGTGFALVLATTVVLSSDAGVLTSDPLALSLLLVAIASVHTVATVLRDSDVEHRGAAILDPLTGMLNRTALINRTAEIEFQSRVTREPVAVVLLDLDRFKQVNDTRGHATGDTVLREVAYRLRKVLRAYDLVYRLGGEEFVVLLLGATAAATAATAERLRAAVADGPIVGIDLTVSVGLAASADGTAFVWDDVFLRADAALYRAKANGRDCVVVEDAVPGDGALVGSAS
jgi:diguanylate cyclase (GGDEF)-like protein